MSDIQDHAWTAPRLPQAEQDSNNPSGQYLSISKLYGISGEVLDCEVLISAGMQGGDHVRVRGRIGEVIYDTPVVRLSTPPRALTVAMPKFMLYGAAGNTMDLNFALSKSGTGDWQISQSRDVRVQSQALTLQRPSLPRGSHTLQVSYNAMASGHKVRARLYASPTSFVDTQEIIVNRPGTIPINIHHSWFETHRGKPVWLNYAVLRTGDSQRLISQVLYIERLEVPTV